MQPRHTASVILINIRLYNTLSSVLRQTITSNNVDNLTNPRCTNSIFYNAPFWKRNMIVWTFLWQNGALNICEMHCEICEKGLLHPSQQTEWKSLWKLRGIFVILANTFQNVACTIITHHFGLLSVCFHWCKYCLLLLTLVCIVDAVVNVFI